jgi:lysophospholipase L1-like esterase
VLRAMSVAAEVGIDPAERVLVRGERLLLPRTVPNRWVTGAHPAGLCTAGPGPWSIPAHHAIDPESVVVVQDGTVLERDVDWLVDPVWGALAAAPSARFDVDRQVSVDYAYSLLRLDALVRTREGVETVRRGQSHLATPLPARIHDGDVRLANVLVPYHGDGEGDVYPITEDASQAPVRTTAGALGDVAERLRAGGPVRIVFWGDSVTCGGEASVPERSFTALLDRALHTAFPGAALSTEVVAVAGSSSLHWLWPETGAEFFTGCDVQRVVDARPDVVVVEFVNDCGLTAEQTERCHSEMLARLAPTGARIVLCTPHFTMLDLMGAAGLRTAEVRPGVAALHALAERHGLALADASSRWAHLWREGLPYVTLLRNGINHPDDRGHRLYAEELMRVITGDALLPGIPA